MKKCVVLLAACFALGSIPSCSKSGADDLDGLAELVREAIENNQPRKLYAATYFQGADPEVEKAMRELFESLDFSELPYVSLEVHEFADFKPDFELPGNLYGRELKWLVEPSHWIVAKATSNKDEEDSGSYFTLALASALIDGKWRIVGATYAEAEKDDTEASVPGLTDQGVTAVAVDDEGLILDFVQIKKGSDIDWIEFHAPENGDWIHVALIGPETHPDIPANSVVSTKIGKGFTNVKVEVDDGKVTGMFGNRVSQRKLLSAADYEEVGRQLGADERTHTDMVKIVKVNRYLESMVMDEEGNKVPKDITPLQKAFLATVIKALKDGDLETLSTYIHREPDDDSRIDTVRSFLERISKEKIESYRFMKFDPVHPDNQRKFVIGGEKSIRTSLPIEWELTLYQQFGSENGASPTVSATLLIGADGDDLKFPTKYSD